MNATLMFAYFGLTYIMTSALYMLITRFYDTPFRNAYEKHPELVKIKEDSKSERMKVFITSLLVSLVLIYFINPLSCSDSGQVVFAI